MQQPVESKSHELVVPGRSSHSFRFPFRTAGTHAGVVKKIHNKYKTSVLTMGGQGIMVQPILHRASPPATPPSEPPPEAWQGETRSSDYGEFSERYMERRAPLVGHPVLVDQYRPLCFAPPPPSDLI